MENTGNLKICNLSGNPVHCIIFAGQNLNLNGFFCGFGS